MPVMKNDEEIAALKIKRAGLQDRSHRNNVIFRGISETVLSADLDRSIQQMIATLLLDTPEKELVFDHAHRLPKPACLPDNAPQDVIAKIHFFLHQR